MEKNLLLWIFLVVQPIPSMIISCQTQVNKWSMLRNVITAVHTLLWEARNRVLKTRGNSAQWKNGDIYTQKKRRKSYKTKKVKPQEKEGGKGTFWLQRKKKEKKKEILLFKVSLSNQKATTQKDKSHKKKCHKKMKLLPFIIMIT